mgnify:CR=1 FL=1
MLNHFKIVNYESYSYNFQLISNEKFDMKLLNIQNLDDFESLNLKQGSIIKMIIDFNKNIFTLECDGSFIGSKEMDKKCKLVQFLLVENHRKDV